MSSDSTTPRQLAQKRREERERTFSVHPSDGAVVGALRWFFGLAHWHYLIEWYTEKSLSRLPDVDREMSNGEAKVVFDKAVERFWLWWSGALVLSYCLAAYVAASGPLASVHSCGGAARPRCSACSQSESVTESSSFLRSHSGFTSLRNTGRIGQPTHWS